MYAGSEVSMNLKKTANWILCYFLILCTVFSGAAVFAEEETETEPVTEGVEETEGEEAVLVLNEAEEIPEEIIETEVTEEMTESDGSGKASKAAQKYAVVISADASDTEIYAARELSEYLSALEGTITRSSAMISHLRGSDSVLAQPLCMILLILQTSPLIRM